jgi:ketosteroid isomerase-like protein
MSAMNVKRTLSAVAAAACLLTASAVADDDPTVAVLERQTNVFSEASARNDQAAMNALLDDDVLFSNGDGTIQRDAGRDASSAVSVSIERQAQEFLDAGRRGDVAAMQRYLDDDLLFVTEDGTLLERSDFTRDPLAAGPQDVAAPADISGWVLRQSGDAAVAAFYDTRTVRDGARTFTRRSLTVETWIQRGTAWKLFGSQTIAVHQDPPLVSVPSDEFNDYVGMYTAGPGYAIAISRDANGLLSSVNGAKPTPLGAQARDAFFVLGITTGYPRPTIVFQRDANGHVTGCVKRVGGAGTIVLTKAGPVPAQSGPAVPTDISSTLALRDFVVHRSGDVAVATFLHDKVTHYNGLVLHATFRSSETWIERGTQWKMLSSQGRELDP